MVLAWPHQASVAAVGPTKAWPALGGGGSIPHGRPNLRQVPRPRSQARRSTIRPNAGGPCRAESAHKQARNKDIIALHPVRLLVALSQYLVVPHGRLMSTEKLQDWLCQQKSCGTAHCRAGEGWRTEPPWIRHGVGSESRSSSVSLAQALQRGVRLRAGLDCRGCGLGSDEMGGIRRLVLRHQYQVACQPVGGA